MAEYFFDLSKKDQREALEYARAAPSDDLLKTCADLEAKVNRAAV